MKYKISIIVFLVIIIMCSVVSARSLEDLKFPDSFQQAVGDSNLYSSILDLPEATNDYYYRFRPPNSSGAGGYISFIPKSAYPDLKMHIRVLGDNYSDSMGAQLYCSTTDDSLGTCAFYNITSDGSLVKASNNPLFYSAHSTFNNTLNAYTNIPVYTDNTYQEIFFFADKTLTEVVQLERATMRETLQEILSILPMILGLLVSFLGLRKAFRILYRLLRQA